MDCRNEIVSLQNSPHLLKTQNGLNETDQRIQPTFHSEPGPLFSHGSVLSPTVSTFFDFWKAGKPLRQQLQICRLIPTSSLLKKVTLILRPKPSKFEYNHKIVIVPEKGKWQTIDSDSTKH